MKNVHSGMTTKILTAIEKNGVYEDRVIAIEFEVPEKGFDLETALECAVEDFAMTEEGKSLIKSNGGVFNLADVETSLPNAFCEAHGFRKLHSVYDEDPIIWDRNFYTVETEAEDEGDMKTYEVTLKMSGGVYKK